MFPWYLIFLRFFSFYQKITFPTLSSFLWLTLSSSLWHRDKIHKSCTHHYQVWLLFLATPTHKTISRLLRFAFQPNLEAATIQDLFATPKIGMITGLFLTTVFTHFIYNYLRTFSPYFEKCRNLEKLYIC